MTCHIPPPNMSPLFKVSAVIPLRGIGDIIWEEVYVFARAPMFVCLSVCKITQKRLHGFGSNVACRQMLGYRRTD